MSSDAVVRFRKRQGGTLPLLKKSFQHSKLLKNSRFYNAKVPGEPDTPAETTKHKRGYIPALHKKSCGEDNRTGAVPVRKALFRFSAAFL